MMCKMMADLEPLLLSIREDDELQGKHVMRKNGDHTLIIVSQVGGEFRPLVFKAFSTL